MSKERRLSKIFAKDGKSVTLALDGYYFSTKTNGIDNTINQLPALVEQGLDCALVTYGMLKNFREPLNSVPVVLRVDSTVSIFDNTVPDTTPMFTVEDALKVGAEGVVCMTFPGAFNEEKTHIMAMQLAQAADCWNVPLIVESLPYGYPVTSDDSNNPAIIAASARAAVELGADVIKTRFTGTAEDRLIVEAAGVPVLALGGPKTGIDGYFKFVQHCMQVGAKGVAVGRNITQDPRPDRVVAGLNAIVHENASAEEAYSLYMAK
ncbi:class I fructose-bisphosphate aldolase [Citrobacter farmeri]|uniref:class I fructose-bisphosphate aldolase n=1 Tax=Citrobacter TaxID=544 RepID=UPI0004D5073D|nr:MULTISPECIES: phospho-2-dehydro-3-deoxyheptonate aldolase [Citrobacter]EKV7297608.1 phospho-2-dehydro-3-deoxyheptonate aldolase [Citrobacter farmeri]KEY51158.1 phospho-2-dehydro-3-deoxyheptonate aldolase [Citrobacter amalonaticus]MBJ8744318.1 phospho-2-dehydro-3-deoxyheptonate aldolase [Citrobacter farmeri]MBJ8757867.1 phospho-2-dehydro-3-deoxyheptonate aldolase [Citrobacter farmeri]MBJ9017868.1 phospho-2-dehydro-3-deoxyheptonate aldolase [Citrobacter farmeri]